MVVHFFVMVHFLIPFKGCCQKWFPIKSAACKSEELRFFVHQFHQICLEGDSALFGHQRLLIVRKGEGVYSLLWQFHTRSEMAIPTGLAQLCSSNVT